MAYELYGSRTSPFVRRLRILMENIPYEFREIDIYSEHARINKLNPVNQIPILIDGPQTVWDSRQVFSYLNEKHKLQVMSWDDQNKLTAIDGAMSAGVAWFLMRKSGIDMSADLLYVMRQSDRIKSVLTYCEQFVNDDWNYFTISLYCFLDWASIRKIINLDDYPQYHAFLKKHASKAVVQKTEIPPELR
jgi:glutathione S-transferase